MTAWESKSKTYQRLQGRLITLLYIPTICTSTQKLIIEHTIARKPPPDVCIHGKSLNPQISVLEFVISALLLNPVTRNA